MSLDSICGPTSSVLELYGEVRHLAQNVPHLPVSHLTIYMQCYKHIYMQFTCNSHHMPGTRLKHLIMHHFEVLVV